MTRVPQILFLLAFLAGCTSGGTALEVREVTNWEGTPMVVDQNDVDTQAPALHALLEQAHSTGFASTEDQSERNQAYEYLRAKSGTNENNFLLEYRGKVFDVGLAVWD